MYTPTSRAWRLAALLLFLAAACARNDGRTDTASAGAVVPDSAAAVPAAPSAAGAPVALTMDQAIELQPLLERLAKLPPLDKAVSPETEQELPRVAGGIGVAFARAFRVIDPDVRNPQSEQWERAMRVFDLLL